MSSDSGREPSELQRAVARFIDGEMSVAEAREFESRAAADSHLAEMLHEAQELRGLFAPGRAEAAPRPDAEFKTRVLREVARLPSYCDWEDDWKQRSQVELRRQIARWSQVIVAAALVLLALGVMVYQGLLGPADSGRLEASPTDIEREMQLLDKKINWRSGEVGERKR